MKRFTMKDGGESYDWMFEAMSPEDYQNFSDDEIRGWVNGLIEVSNADYYMSEVEEEANTLTFPRMVYTTDLIEYDEYIALKKAEFESDLQEAREEMFNAAKAWIASSKMNNQIEALLLNDWSDINILNRGNGDDTHPFNDNGGNPDGNSWLLVDYTLAEKEILVANGAEVVTVNVVDYERDEDGDYPEFAGKWMGMQIEETAYIVIS